VRRFCQFPAQTGISITLGDGTSLRKILENNIEKEEKGGGQEIMEEEEKEAVRAKKLLNEESCFEFDLRRSQGKKKGDLARDLRKRKRSKRQDASREREKEDMGGWGRLFQ